MGTAEKIEELKQIISLSKDDRLINMVYALVKEYQSGSNDISISGEQTEELKRRINLRNSGKSTSHPWDEVQAKLKAI